MKKIIFTLILTVLLCTLCGCGEEADKDLEKLDPSPTILVETIWTETIEVETIEIEDRFKPIEVRPIEIKEIVIK